MLIKKSQKERLVSGKSSRQKSRGFTLIEVIVVVAILGLASLALYPLILNSLETRSLDSEARKVLSTLERTKFRAVKTKLDHRLRFYQQQEQWYYQVEVEESADNWQTVTGEVPQAIPIKFNVTINLPNQWIEFSPIGIVVNYDPQMNSIVLQSDRLQQAGQPDVRRIWVYQGGSIRYQKEES
ncbi:type II secretion system GspH family protein [Candidatus Aminicenantes bacterium AC-334-K16]|jgi:prepilin-type N-terminal cleavage/methylation domain-containing protein|nr:type II secretion system GspH family protein [Candidatus Aminicenantes bacterium AC-334-K16]